MKRSFRLFFDANIYIAALASPQGPSGRLLELGRQGKFKIITAKFLLLEVERNLQKKLSEALPYFYQDITQIDFEFVTQLKPDIVKYYEQIIDYKPDSLVLAACDQGQAKFLVTLDKKHFLKDELNKQVSFVITRPEDMLKMFEQLSTSSC